MQAIWCCRKFWNMTKSGDILDWHSPHSKFWGYSSLLSPVIYGHDRDITMSSTLNAITRLSLIKAYFAPYTKLDEDRWVWDKISEGRIPYFGDSLILLKRSRENKSREGREPKASLICAAVLTQRPTGVTACECVTDTHTDRGRQTDRDVPALIASSR